MERLPHLLATLQSIAGQHDSRVECLVVEQDVESRVAGHLPGWVRYIHSPPPTPDMPFCRSWAFNVGVKNARGAVLVLHDNDMLVPSDYAGKILESVRKGYEAVNPKRFIFYLGEQHTCGVFAGLAEFAEIAPATITQNLEAGGSVAITRAAFEQIGGMDENFIGWGGEDNEFWDRAKTLRVWDFGSLSLVHLWHAAQPGKHQADSGTSARYRALQETSIDRRISSLRDRARGEASGPSGWREWANGKEGASGPCAE